VEATQKTKGIILRRENFLENNSRVFVYTRDFGKVSLVARGTAKLTSKLSGHIEPLNLCDIMIVKGKQHDYVGSCVSENIFVEVKKNYDKIFICGAAVSLVDDIIKGQEKDERIFFMLKKFLEILNAASNDARIANLQLVKTAFALKLITILGYEPKLNMRSLGAVRVNKNLADFLSVLLRVKFDEIIKINCSDVLAKEAAEAILAYKLYIFD